MKPKTEQLPKKNPEIKKKSQLRKTKLKKKIPRPTEGRPGVYYGVWSVTGAVSLLHFRLIELTESYLGFLKTSDASNYLL